jgi:hypothetical protein
MVCHGDEQAELPLLWRVCSALVSLGYAVAVLDATKTESDANPGLEQMLDCRFGPGPCEPDTPDWTVIPAYRGMLQLCHTQTNRKQSLLKLGQLFQTNGVLILYGSAEILVKLLHDSQAKPLLAVSSAQSSLLTSYLALKRLLIHGHLEPTILNVLAQTGENRGDSTSTVSVNLGECAKNFLGYDVKALTMDPHAGEAALTAAVRRLAAGLLEHAEPLGRITLQPQALRASDFSPQLAGSH